MPIRSSRKTFARGPLAGLVRIIGAAAAVIIALQAAGPASAQPSVPEQQQFAHAFVAALRSQDVRRLEAMIHPATLACITAANRAYFDQVFKSELALGPRLGPNISVQPPERVTAGDPSTPPADGFVYPVQPSYRIQIAARGGRGPANVVQAYLAPGPGGWFIVHPCPNATGMRFFAELSPQRKIDGAAVVRLTANMSPRLHEEIGALLQDGRFIDAVHRFMAVSGADADTAVIVVQMQRYHKDADEGH
jgi:hypothetical protein